RRPVLVCVRHRGGATHRAQDRIAVRIGDGPGRGHDGAWRLDVYIRVNACQGICAVGADDTARAGPDELVINSPTGAKYRLGVDLIGDAQPRPDSIWIGGLIELAVARVG